MDWDPEAKRGSGVTEPETETETWFPPCTGCGTNELSKCHNEGKRGTEDMGGTTGCAGWDQRTKFNGRKTRTKLIAKDEKGAT